jgi:hypothetical protein
LTLIDASITPNQEIPKMRFGRVLHPEIVLGKRGRKEEIEFIQKALSITEIDPRGGLTWEGDRDDLLAVLIGSALEQDQVFVRWVTSCKRFVQTKNAPTYHVGQEFLQALQKVDIKVPMDIIPETFCAYFSFASKTVFDEADEIEGGYVCVGRGRNLGMDAKYADLRIITFAYNCKATQDSPFPPVGSLTVPLDVKTIDELASGAPLQDYFVTQSVKPSQEANAKRNEVFRTLLNCLIYIHSEEPIIERSVPLADSNKTIKEHKKLGHIINACTIPVNFLWPNYQKARRYKVDSTWIDSFPRWQRCGPGLTSVKLVFVRGHERNFNTDSLGC